MAAFIVTLLLLLLFILAFSIPRSVSQSSDLSGPMCYDWGESREAEVSVLEGEVGWLSCPLFSHPSVYNYTSTKSAGHDLYWYRLPEGHDLEQPITSSSRLSKDRERLWLQPAVTADTGQYICMLRNKSSCSKIAMRLKVLRPDEAVRGPCDRPVAVAPSQVIIPLQEGKVLDCPDLQDAAKMADSEPTVTWLYMKSYSTRCVPKVFHHDPEITGNSLEFHIMYSTYQGSYYCTVQYQRKGRSLNFTRSINITAVYPSTVSKFPSILNPAEDQYYTVKQHTNVRLWCKALFPFLDPESKEIWWTVDGQRLDRLPDHHRFSQNARKLKYDFGDWQMECELLIQDFQSEDLNREFNCSVNNTVGFLTRRAQLKEEGEENEHTSSHGVNESVSSLPQHQI